MEVTLLNVKDIINNPEQPRTFFDENSLLELANNIKENGQITPILVRPYKGYKKYIIVNGERRWRACKLANITTIYAEIRDIENEDDAYILSFIENEQRTNLNSIEIANAIYKMSQFTPKNKGEIWNINALSKKIGRSGNWISLKLRLLKLPKKVQDYMYKGLLTEGHAHQLLRLYKCDFDKITILATDVIKKELSVSLLKKKVDNILSNSLIYDEAKGFVEENIGYFYVIQIDPMLNPYRIKLGFAINVYHRIQAHRAIASTLNFVCCWKCKRLWEKTAIEGLTFSCCTKIKGEVYDCKNITELIDRGNKFFALMGDSHCYYTLKISGEVA